MPAPLRAHDLDARAFGQAVRERRHRPRDPAAAVDAAHQHRDGEPDGGHGDEVSVRAMAKALYVHIGAPKSGSTYLQGRLHASAGELADVGLLLPGVHADPFRLKMGATGREGSLRRPDAGAQAWDRVF